MTPDQEARLQYLEGVMARFMLQDRYYAQTDIQLADGRSLIVGGNKGTKIGQSASKLGLYGATPIAQQVAIASPSVSNVSGSGADSTINTNFTNLKTTVDTLRTDLKNVGITA